MLAYNPLVKFVASLDAIPNVDQPSINPSRARQVISYPYPLPCAIQFWLPVIETSQPILKGEICAGNVPPSFNIALRGSPAEQLTWP